MYVCEQQEFTPGSVVRVFSKRNGFFHKGVIDWPDGLSGETRVIHSAKGSFVRTTTLSEFCEGQQVDVLWIPQNHQQQISVLQRMHSLEGMPYDIFVANCEHVVNWALTGRAFSEQLSFVVLILILVLGSVGISKALSA